MDKITELQFDNSFDNTFKAFTGRYNGKFFCGNNSDGKFKVGNYKDFHGYEKHYIEKIVNEEAWRDDAV